MPCHKGMLVCLLCLCGLATAGAQAAPARPAAIVCDVGASPAEKLAAKEIRRYIYLRTGALLPIVSPDAHRKAPAGSSIVVGTKDRPAVTALLSDAKLKAEVEGLAPQQFLLKTIDHGDRTVLVVVGGDPIGALYGSYRLAERFGARFYLHGDVLPDRQTPLEMPILNETGKPLFDPRGINPFHDFPEGPDWWNRDAYKAIVGQLPKMGMNFIGMHCYPETNAGAEPLVWIGPADQIAPDGRVKSSYPSRHFTTVNADRWWGYRSTKTSDYAFGAAEMFDRDNFGADYMRGMPPWNRGTGDPQKPLTAEQRKAMTPEQCNELFDRMGETLGDVFGYARRLGVKTAVGAEMPLTIPTPVKQRLRAAGKNPDDPAVVQKIYEGIFQRIAKTHPLDYYWLWTDEGWTWNAVSQPQIDAVMADFRAAIAAANKVKAPFTLATCGWVLGPPQSPALFDQSLPKEMPMGCINREVGRTPLEPGFAKVIGRPTWAIPWLEDDQALTMPQLWAGRMRRDAADALKYGCTGLMGIHWRTRILSPNVSALAKAAWDQTGWSDESKTVAKKAVANPAVRPRYLPVNDFYADWARSEFGPKAAKPGAALFTRLDGHLPRPADWITGPGSILPDPRPWNQVQKEYAFVDEMEALRPLVEGPGNLERYQYWLDNFRYLRSIAKVRCVWGRYNAALDKVKAEKNRDAQKTLARNAALPIRKELVAAFAELHRHLLATVSNPGEMGAVCNWQQQTMPVLLTSPGRELAKLLGEELPADAMPSKQYAGPPRIFVREVRTGIAAGETLKLTVIVMGPKPDSPKLYWRPLGKGGFASIPLMHVARGVYTVAIPPEAVKDDFEYYTEAAVDGRTIRFPPAGAAMPQTVVVE